MLEEESMIFFFLQSLLRVKFWENSGTWKRDRRIFCLRLLLKALSEMGLGGYSSATKKN